MSPCRVCGEASTGFHYGVNTCGACKGFFFRSLMRQEPYVCAHNEVCYIGHSTSANRRKSCQKCRYEKCVAVGMSKDAIKIGRHPLAKEFANTRQVKIETASLFNSLGEGTTTTMHPQHQTQRQIGMSLTSDNALNLPLKMEHGLSVSDWGVNPEGEFLLKEGENAYGVQKQYRHDSTTHDNGKHFENVLIKGTSHNEASERLKINDMECDMDVTMQCSDDECNTLTHGDPQSSTSCKSAVAKDSSFRNPNFQNDDLFHRTSPNNKSTQKIECQSMQDPNGNSSLQKFQKKIFHQTPETTFLEPLTSSLSDCLQSNSITNLRCVSPFGSNLHNLDNTASCPNTTDSTSKQFLHNSDRVSSSSEQVLGSNQFSSLPIDHPLSSISQQHMKQSSAGEIQSSPFSCSSPSHTEKHNNIPLLYTNMNDVMSSLETIITSQRSESKSCYIKVADCCSSDNSTANSQQSVKQPTRYNNSVFKAKLPECENVNGVPTKKQCLSTFVEHDSYQMSTLKTTKTTLSDMTHKPSNWQIPAPSTTPPALSMFDSFPFKSFQTQTLAQILKIYAVDYGEGMALVKKKQLRKTVYQSRKAKSIPPFTCSSMSSYTTPCSSEQPASAQDLHYDASEMDRLYIYLHEVHSHYYGHESTYLTESERETAIDMFTKMCQLQDVVLGEMKIIDDDAYYKILDATGIDVDKRKEWMASIFGDFDAGFTRDVKFIRSLPGFKDFKLNDRTVLTKTTFPIFKNLRSFRTTDVDRDVLIDEEAGVSFRLSVLKRIVRPMSDFMDLWGDCVAILKDVDVSFDELIILKALCIINPGMCEGLEDLPLVTYWHNTYLKCLLHLMRKNHGPKADDGFNRILEFIQKLSHSKDLMKECRIQAIDTFFRLTRGLGKPLFTEMYINPFFF